jgi:hypothetical protein
MENLGTFVFHEQIKHTKIGCCFIEGKICVRKRTTIIHRIIVVASYQLNIIDVKEAGPIIYLHCSSVVVGNL